MAGLVTLASLWPWVAPGLHAASVPDIDGLEALAARLPRVEAFGFELHLGRPRVDLSLLFQPGASPAELATLVRLAELPTALPGWLPRVVSAWASDRRLLGVPELWAEIDRDGDAETATAAFLGFPRDRAPDAPTLLAAAAALGLAPAVGDAIVDFASTSGLGIRHLGTFPERPGSPARLTFPFAPRVGLPALLATGLPLDPRLPDLVEAVGPHVTTAHVDVGLGPLPGIGLDLGVTDIRDRAAWRPLLARLADVPGAPALAERFDAWETGEDGVVVRLPGRAEKLRISRCVSHVKVGLHPGRPLEWKMYLGVRARAA